MSIETLKSLMEDTDLSDDQLSVLLEQAKRRAVNHHFWKQDDEPSVDDLMKFYTRYEFEIYNVAKALDTASARDGETQHTELGITRVWGRSGEQSVTESLEAIPTKTYIV